MTTATLGTLLLVAILALAATCAVLVYIEHRRDLAWDAEQDALDDRDAAWQAHVSEALAAASETPIGDAVAARIAAHLAADVDREWGAMQP